MQDALRDANLSLRIEKDLLDRAKARAAMDDRSLAQLVRRALRQYVDDREVTDEQAAA